MSHTVTKHINVMDLEEMNGFFYGMLNEEEQKIVDQAVTDHKAIRVYDGVGGLLGLSQVRVLNEREQAAMALHAECRR